MSPGAGEGNQAAATADILAAIPMLTKHLNSFPIGDKKRQALMRAVTALEAHFGKSVDEALAPAAVTKMARGLQTGAGPSMHGMPPPGIALGGPQPMSAMGGGAMGAGPPGPGA